MILETSTRPGLACLAAAALVVAVLSTCKTSQQAREVRGSGFLGDYSQMSEGGEDEALLNYWKEDVVFSSYDKILIDPVKVYARIDSNMDRWVSAEDQQRLANLFHNELRRSLGQDYELVEQPGPNTLRLRTALCDAESVRAGLKLAMAMPPLRTLDNLGSLVTGTRAFVGKASVEGEIQDSQSGERLAAGVDRRMGSRTLRGAANRWADVHLIFEHWADQLARSLRRHSGKSAPDGH